MSTNPKQYDRTHLGPENYSESTMLPPLEELEGMEVRDVSGEKVGKVDDTYTDTGGDYVRYLAVKTGWFGTKRHMIPVDDVRAESDGDEMYLAVPYGKDQLRAAPTHDRDEDFTRGHEDATYGHYGRTGYWDAIRARQRTPAATPEIAEAEGADPMGARQNTPAPTPEIAEAEAADAVRRGDDPSTVAVKRWGV